MTEFRNYNRSGDVQHPLHDVLTAAHRICEHVFGSAG